MDQPMEGITVVEVKDKIDHMTYLPGMEQIDPTVRLQVTAARDGYDETIYTAKDVRAALDADVRTPEHFAALLSPAAEPFLEEMAQKARMEKRRYFGDNVYLFTPIYISNYCENYCIYCGFNCHNKIRRAKLDMAGIEAEMAAIAKTGLEEILILTGESRKMSDVQYIGEACKIARKYFKMVGIEVYPMNSDEYAYLHQCGVDYVTVFQETYHADRYEQLHLAGPHRRTFRREHHTGRSPSPYAEGLSLGLTRSGLFCPFHAGTLVGFYGKALLRCRPFFRSAGRIRRSRFPLRSEVHPDTSFLSSVSGHPFRAGRMPQAGLEKSPALQ